MKPSSIHCKQRSRAVHFNVSSESWRRRLACMLLSYLPVSLRNKKNVKKVEPSNVSSTHLALQPSSSDHNWYRSCTKSPSIQPRRPTKAERTKASNALLQYRWGMGVQSRDEKRRRKCKATSILPFSILARLVWFLEGGSSHALHPFEEAAERGAEKFTGVTLS